MFGMTKIGCRFEACLTVYLPKAWQAGEVRNLIIPSNIFGSYNLFFTFNPEILPALIAHED